MRNFEGERMPFLNKNVQIFKAAVFFILIFGLSTTLLFHYDLISLGSPVYSVSEVISNAPDLLGEDVRVVGNIRVASFRVTNVLCIPDHCDCNETSFAYLAIYDQPFDNHPFNGIDVIHIDVPPCSGNQCTVSCSVFDPDQTDHFELVGRLVPSYANNVAKYSLTDIDFDSSKILMDGEWVPIILGPGRTRLDFPD